MTDLRLTEKDSREVVDAAARMIADAITMRSEANAEFLNAIDAYQEAGRRLVESLIFSLVQLVFLGLSIWINLP